MRASLLLAAVFVFVAAPARADFLILKNGETYRGTLTVYDDGSMTITEAEYRYDPEDVARSSKVETVDEVIANWSREIGPCKSGAARESCLSLGKFCVVHGRYKEAKKFFTLWGKVRKWTVYSSKYYFILGNTKKKRMKEIGLRLDAIMRFYQKEFGEDVAEKQDFVVRFFKSEGQFEAFARAAGLGEAGAFYDAQLRELVLWDMSLTNKNYTFQAVFHEAQHQFFEAYYLDHQPKHVWFCEGMATYYETAKYKSKRIVDHGKKSRDYLTTFQKGSRGGRLTPLKTFLAMEYEAFHCGGRQESLNYAHAWALVYFFKNTKDKKCRAFFQRYVDVLRETKDDAKALASAFEEASLEEVTEAFDAFRKKL